MARTLIKPLFTAVLFSAFIFSTLSISPFDLSHIPTEPLCFTPLAGAENTHPAASYVYDAASFFHPNPQRLTVPQQAVTEIANNPLLAAIMPYAQQYMGHRTKGTQKSNGVGAGAAEETSNTTVHAWFIIFLVILGGLAWTAHHTVKSADNEERKEKEKKAAEQAEKDKFKRSLVVGPIETIEVPMEGDGEIIREAQDQDQYEQRDEEVAHYGDGNGNGRYVNPNYYSEHENTYAAQQNGYSQQEPSYYENQEPAYYNQGNEQGSSTYDPHQGQYQGHQQQNGQYYDDRQALDQYGASQGPSDYEGQAGQYGNYQYEDDQDLANLVDEK